MKEVGHMAWVAFGSEYKACGLRERWMWLRRREDVIGLSEGLSCVETRKTAREVAEVLVVVGDMGRDLEGVRDAVERLGNSLSRVVGVRRVG